MSDELKPCPFCGNVGAVTEVDREQGTKWGYVICPTCCARGPEVRTQYDEADNAPWRAEAIAEWNRRPAASPGGSPTTA